MFLQTFGYFVTCVSYNAECEYNLMATAWMGSLLTAWHIEGMQLIAWAGEDSEYVSSSIIVYLPSCAYLYT